MPIQRPEDVAWPDPDEMPLPALHQTLAWQRRPEQVDAACVAVWPAAGWLHLQTGAHAGQVYVYAPGDWPLHAWPCGVAFALAMLGLWWRERR